MVAYAYAAIAIVDSGCYGQIADSSRHTLLTAYKIATDKERHVIKRARFDGDAFYAALDGERLARQCTWKRVAEESGISASTLTRDSQGKRPDVDGLAALSA